MMSRPVSGVYAGTALPSASIKEEVGAGVRMALRAVSLPDVGTGESMRRSSGIFPNGTGVQVCRIHAGWIPAQVIDRLTGRKISLVDLEAHAMCPDGDIAPLPAIMCYPVSVFVDRTFPQPAAVGFLDFFQEANDRISWLWSSSSHTTKYTIFSDQIREWLG